MENTLDVWEIPAESARRVGHPAPFPVELPERLIHLYTYAGDLVLDPFLGSGTTAVAAVRTGRHYVGYDTDPSYVALAERRVSDERDHVAVTPPTKPQPAIAEGRAAKEIARAALARSGLRRPRREGEAAQWRRGDLLEPRRRRVSRGCSRCAAGSRAIVPGCSGPTRSGRRSPRRQCSIRSDRTRTSCSSRPASRRRAARPGKALAAVCGPDRPIYSVVSLLTATGAQRLAHCYRGD